MKALIINREVELEESKIFGDVYLPESWLMEDVFSPYEFFLSQINLEDFFEDKKGYLYFFVEAYSLSKLKMKPKVRFYEGEPDSYTEFNEGFFDEDPECFAIKKESIGTLNIFEETENTFLLLEIPSNFLPFDINCAKIAFYMQKDDFLKNDYTNVSLVFIN